MSTNFGDAHDELSELLQILARLAARKVVEKEPSDTPATPAAVPEKSARERAVEDNWFLDDDDGYQPEEFPRFGSDEVYPTSDEDYKDTLDDMYE
jgi:hypothetical protein